MKAKNNSNGFTLVELMIVIALIAMFLVMATPNIRTYLENSKVSATAESIKSGMQIARFHALKSNRLTQFVLTTDATGVNGWVVREQIPGVPPALPTVANIETFVWGAGAGGKNWVSVDTVAVDTGGGTANAVTFNGMGRIAATNPVWTGVNPPASAAPVAQINVSSNTGMAGVVPFRVDTGTARSIRVCRPDLPATDSKGC